MKGHDKEIATQISNGSLLSVIGSALLLSLTIYRETQMMSLAAVIAAATGTFGIVLPLLLKIRNAHTITPSHQSCLGTGLP